MYNAVDAVAALSGEQRLGEDKEHGGQKNREEFEQVGGRERGGWAGVEDSLGAVTVDAAVGESVEVVAYVG